VKSMGFSNREKSVREEIATRKKDYETFKELRLNQESTNLVIKTGEDISGSIQGNADFCKFNEPKYQFTTFKEVCFGYDDADAEWEFLKVENTKFYFCTFDNCSFSNIKFINCLFVGCTFSQCFTLNYGVVFEECNFSKNDSEKNSIDDMFSYFRFCELTVKFKKCDMSLVLFSKTNFYFSSFADNKMFDIIMVDCGFDITVLSDCDLRNAKIINTKFISFSFEDTGAGTRVNRSTFFGDINFNKKDRRELTNAVNMYFALKELYQDNKISDLYGEYFYLYKKTEMLTHKGLSRMMSFVSFVICGYGERPFYSLIVSLAMVFICGNLYYVFGLNTHSGILIFNASSSLNVMLEDLYQCYHFSLVTFSTVGYGNVIPIGASIVVNEIEMVCAIILVGIWVSTLVRKMVR